MSVNKLSESIAAARGLIRKLTDDHDKITENYTKLAEAYDRVTLENIYLKIELCLAKGVEPTYELIGNIAEDYSIELFNKMVEEVKIANTQ